MHPRPIRAFDALRALRRPLRACLLSLLLVASTAIASPPLMLARVAPSGLDPTGYLVSEKLDGVRGRWDGQRMWTRGGEPVALPAWFTRGWPPLPMDGELWIDRGRFEEVSALVRSHAPRTAQWRSVRFLVFDLPAHGGRFRERAAAMQALLGDHPNPHLGMITQRRASSPAGLEAMLEAVVRAGGEGLMLHHADAYYRDGRSDALLKLKPFDDAEGTVVDYTHGRGKYRGLVGALVLKLDDGRLLRVGSGLSDADRATPPALGSRVTFRYSGLTSTGLPRFARYLRVRHE